MAVRALGFAVAVGILAADLSGAEAADRRVRRCIFTELAGTEYADGPCILRDFATPQGSEAAYFVVWTGGVSSSSLRLKVVVRGQGTGASQELTLDDQPATGYEMARGRYLIVTRNGNRAIILEY